MPREATLDDFAGGEPDTGSSEPERSEGDRLRELRPPLECDCPDCRDDTILVCSDESTRLLQIDYDEH